MKSLKHFRQQLFIRDSSATVWFLSVFFVIMALVSAASSDMYVPSLPHIAQYFNVSATQVKMTITWYFIGFGVMQLFFGPLSDAFGRRPIAILGMVIFNIGALLCIEANSIVSLEIGRLIQGMGAASVVAMIRSMSRDAFSGERLAKIASYFTSAFAVAPVIAPMIGAYLQRYWHWQMVFYVMLGYGLLALLFMLLLLPETNRNIVRKTFRPQCILHNYVELCRQPLFMGYALLSGLAYGSIISFFTLSSFLFQVVLHISVLTYGWLMLTAACGMLLGRVGNAILISYFPSIRLLSVGFIIMLLAALFLLISSLLGWLNPGVIVIPTLIYLAGTSFVFANAFANAMTIHKSMVGLAGAFYGAIQMGVTFVASLIAAHLHGKSSLDLAVLLLSLSVIGTGLRMLLKRRAKRT